MATPYPITIRPSIINKTCSTRDFSGKKLYKKSKKSTKYPIKTAFIKVPIPISFRPKISWKVNNIKFIIYGDGPRKEPLEQLALKLRLDNVVFKGRVEKKYIPFILSKSNLNLISGISGNIGAYGVSWNKLFEYMASGKPICANYNLGDYYKLVLPVPNILEQEKISDFILKLDNLITLHQHNSILVI